MGVDTEGVVERESVDAGTDTGDIQVGGGTLTEAVDAGMDVVNAWLCRVLCEG